MQIISSDCLIKSEKNKKLLGNINGNIKDKKLNQILCIKNLKC